MTPHFLYSANLWSALAAVASAVCAGFSYFVTHNTYRENKRSADAAEQTLIDQRRPILTMRFLTPWATNEVLLVEIANVGRGPAFGLIAMPVTEDEALVWDQDRNVWTNPTNIEGLVLLDQGQALVTGARLEATLEKKFFGPGHHAILGCNDDHGDAYQFRISVNETVDERYLLLLSRGYVRKPGEQLRPPKPLTHFWSRLTMSQVWRRLRHAKTSQR